MSSSQSETLRLRHEIQRLSQRVQGLRTVVYGQSDPSNDQQRHEQLSREETILHDLEQQLAGRPGVEEDERPAAVSSGRFLGPKTTGLVVESSLKMHPLPTGVFHLLDPETDPLLTVKVANVSRDPR